MDKDVVKMKQKHTHRYREKLVFARGDVGGKMDEKGKGNTEVQTSSFKRNEVTGCKIQHRENINSIIITLYDDRWLLDLLWRSHHKVCKCYTCETNIILYVNYTSI